MGGGEGGEKMREEKQGWIIMRSGAAEGEEGLDEQKGRKEEDGKAR